jgi:hypothetical protein
MANTCVRLSCPHCGRSLDPGGSECPTCRPPSEKTQLKRNTSAPRTGILVSQPASPRKRRTEVRVANVQAKPAPLLKRILAGLSVLLILIGIVIPFALRRQAGDESAPSAVAARPAEPIAVSPAPSRKEPAPVAEATTPTSPSLSAKDMNTERVVGRREEKVQLQRKERKEDVPVAAAVKAPAVPAVPAAPAPVPPLNKEQANINAAIDRGIRYLKSHPWDHPQHPTGYTALAALTLLECGVSADDPLIQRAAVFIRGQAAKLNHTYQIALSILFLDRLGRQEDHRLLQALSLRLLAGQNAAGGWWYTVPVLPPGDMAQLYKFLRSHQTARAASGRARQAPCRQEAGGQRPVSPVRRAHPDSGH